MTGLERVVQAAFWNYLASLTNSICGFLFWILVFKFVRPETVGYIAAIVVLSSTINTITSLGLEVGLLRYLGEASERMT